MRPAWISLLGICGVASFCQGADLFVPGDYPTISGALEVAEAGDTVWVAPGDYIDSVAIGPGVAVVATEGRRATSLHGLPDQHAVYFHPGTEPALIRGLLVSPGGSFNYAIVSSNPLCEVVDCFVGAGSDWMGPGVLRMEDGGAVRRCIISNDSGGPVVRVRDPGAHLLLEDCWFTPNVFPESMGGIPSGAWIEFRNCTFHLPKINPTVRTDGAHTDFAVTFENCIFSYHAILPYHIDDPYPDGLFFSFNCFWDWDPWEYEVIPPGSQGPGNFMADPLFCEGPDPTDLPDQWWLDEDSPCIGTGSGGANIGARYGVCGVSAVEPTHSPAPGAGGLVAWPNPAGDRVSIRLRSPLTAELGVDVINALGQQVAFLRGPLDGQDGFLEWDTRDDAGRRVPSGIYFLRGIGDAGNSGWTRVTVVR